MSATRNRYIISFHSIHVNSALLLLSAVFVVRWVSDDLYSNEEFLGLYQLPNIEASTLTCMIDSFQPVPQ